MVKQVEWTKVIVESFLDEAGINDRVEMGDEKARILEAILRTRVAGWTRTKQSHVFNCSVETVDGYIKELKEIYDKTQESSIILPKRKASKIEDELDK